MAENFTLNPVEGGLFVGRKEIMREMLAELTNPESHAGFCLLGRRRMGKTSIFRELESELSGRKGVVFAYLSLADLADVSVKTFAEQLSMAVLEASRKKGILPLEYSMDALMKSPREVIQSSLSKVKLTDQISDELSFFFESGKGKNEDDVEAVHRAFDLGDKLAKAHGSKFVLVLDEFPEILKLDDGEQMVKMFRTIHDKQRNTALIISGSEKKTLEQVALSPESPFYKQLIFVELQPFSFEETVQFLKKYGLVLSDADARKLYYVSGGMPYYLQYFGRSGKLTQDIDAAIANFIKEEGGVFFSEELGKLSKKEKVIVRAIAAGESSPTGIAEKSGEPVTSVSSYLVSLQRKEIVEKARKAEYVLSDRLFALWMQERYR
jgi:AAA+ ATPase superfamily predicted ATPase